jgi:nucleoside-diphosphate-sugar epimerase
MDMVNELARAAGKQTSIVQVPRDLIVRNGGDVFRDPLYFGQYYDLPPITAVVERVKRVLQVEPTSFAVGLRETYQWYSDQAERRPPDFSFDDKLIRDAAAG